MSVPKYHLPAVENWDALDPKTTNPRNSAEWNGKIPFVNAEGRVVNMTVRWNPMGMTAFLGHARRLKLASDMNNKLKAITEHYAVVEAARLGSLEVLIL